MLNFPTHVICCNFKPPLLTESKRALRAPARYSTLVSHRRIVPRRFGAVLSAETGRRSCLLVGSDTPRAGHSPGSESGAAVTWPLTQAFPETHRMRAASEWITMSSENGNRNDIQPTGWLHSCVAKFWTLQLPFLFTYWGLRILKGLKVTWPNLPVGSQLFWDCGATENRQTSVWCIKVAPKGIRIKRWIKGFTICNRHNWKAAGFAYLWNAKGPSSKQSAEPWLLLIWWQRFTKWISESGRRCCPLLPELNSVHDGVQRPQRWQPDANASIQPF